MQKIKSISSIRYLKINELQNKKSSMKLSSGFKINSAADDAAGLTITNKMRWQIRGLAKASRNATDGKSFYDVADGALDEVQSMVKRQRELSIQAANDTNTEEDRDAIQSEVNEITDELRRIFDTTEFNTKYVFRRGSSDLGNGNAKRTLAEILGQNGTSGNKKLDLDMILGVGWDSTGNVGPAGNGGVPGNAYGGVWMDFSDFGNSYGVYDLNMTGFNCVCATCKKHYSVLFVDGGGNQYKSGANPLLNVDINGVTSGADMVQRLMSALKSAPDFINHFTQYAVDPSQPTKIFMYDNRTAYNSSATPPYKPGGDSNFEMIPRNTSGSIISNVDRTKLEEEALWIQTGARQDDGFFIDKPILTAEYLNLDLLDVGSYKSASQAIKYCDEAEKIIGEKRTKVGVASNRLEHSMSIANIIGENTTAAESRISDTDMAKEMVEYSKTNIMRQWGNSILAQTNADREQILNLLRSV